MMWKKATEEVRYADDDMDRITGRNRGVCSTFCRHYADMLNFLLFVPKGKVVLHMVNDDFCLNLFSFT